MTSIGYDGEEVDNVTGLPKPRIRVNPGNLVATAESCFNTSEAELVVLERTDIPTSLGMIIIGEAVSGGRVVLAGPNKGRDVKKVLEALEKLSAELVLVDGALNRIVPLMETDGIIIATGAARSLSVDYLEGEISSIIRLFSLPLTEKTGEENISLDDSHVSIKSSCGDGSLLDFSSIIRKEHIEAVLSVIDETVEWVGIPGLCPVESIKYLAKKSRGIDWGKKIVLRNPSQLVLNRDISETAGCIDGIIIDGLEVRVERTLPILAVTVNPFYPVYQSAGGGDVYKPGLIDGEKLLSQIRSAVEVPVLDIFKEGPGGCMELINLRLES